MLCYNRRPKIGLPTNFRHLQSIKINQSTGKFDGLPKAWELILKSQVGYYKELPNIETVLKDGHFYNFLPTDSTNTEIIVTPNKIQTKPKTKDEIYAELRGMCNVSDSRIQFKIINKLSNDHSGTVYVGRNLTSNEIVAIKQIDMAHKTFRNVPKEFNLIELRILRNFNDHPNLINFIDAFWIEPIERLLIIMEYMEGGTLTSVIIETIMNDRQIAVVTREILKGVQFLHSKNIFHRDIRSNNILLGLDGSVKLANFAFCAIIEKNRRFSTAVGSAFWMAPEVAAQSHYGVKVDIWSTGITIIEMINGSPPNFELEPLLAMCLIATKVKPKIEEFDTCSPNLQNFLDRCLEIDATCRASAVELLSHPFLENCAELQTLIPLIIHTNEILKDESDKA